MGYRKKIIGLVEKFGVPETCKVLGIGIDELFVITMLISGAYLRALGNVDSTTTYSLAPAAMAPKVWRKLGEPS